MYKLPIGAIYHELESEVHSLEPPFRICAATYLLICHRSEIATKEMNGFPMKMFLSVLPDY
jgi:hypothetical protein